MTTPQILAGIIARDLRALRREIESYPDDASLWAKPAGIANPGGALAHHLASNLRHFVGARLGGGDFVRDRPSEFARTDLGREDLVRMIDAALGDVERVVPSLGADGLEADFPDPVAGQRVGTLAFLTHLATHLAYHLGQIDYHRRIVTGDAGTVDTQSVAEIPGAGSR